MLAKSKIIVANNEEIRVVDGHTLAILWGQEDGRSGVSMRGSVYFVIGSPAWEAYNEAYHAATAKRLVESGQPICAWTFENADKVLPADKRDDYVGM